jgi:hypothetical protein
MCKFWRLLALALLFISQSVNADERLLNDLIENVTDSSGSYYMEYYVLSGARFLYFVPPSVDAAISAPYSLDGWHGIVPYNLYRNKLRNLKNFKLKSKKMPKAAEVIGLRGRFFEIYAFKKYSSNIINQVLYTIDIVIGEGIAITKYYDNIPITKQFFEYNNKFRNLLIEMIPANQVQSDNGWEATDIISGDVPVKRNLLNDLIKDVTNIEGNYYMEYYVLSLPQDAPFSSGFPLPYVRVVIENPYSLDGWHGIVNYDLYKNKILALKKFNLKESKMYLRSEKFGFEGYNFEIYAFKKYGSTVINQVLYTVDIVIDDGIVITKYYDNIPITKQFFDYNDDFRNLLREIIPANQLQNDNGWKGSFE